MTTLSPDDARRAVLAAKLLSSSVEGERSAAFAALNRLLGKCGHSVESIITFGLKALSPEQATGDVCANPWRPTPRPYEADVWSTHRFTVEMCLARKDSLNDREISFLGDILNRRRLTEKQQAWLDDIEAKVGRQYA